MKTELGNKEIFAKNLNRYMKIYNVDRIKLAEAINVKYSSVADWCKGVYYPRIDRIEDIADFFGIEKADLIEDRPHDTNDLLASMKKNTVRVPLLGNIPAGVPFEAIENSYAVDYEEVPADWCKGDKKYFALKLKGDSMEPKYSDGDIVVFLKTSEFTSGQDCCVRINGNDATFKRVTIEKDGIMLSPLNIHNNSGFLPRLYSKEEVANLPIEIIGVAKKLTKYLD